jgi:LuxR family maltose regulon positive regulatory protein
LTTYLPFGEIATELFLSTHTIKTQARSIYRKLGATTRSQAVTQARELGLLDG